MSYGLALALALVQAVAPCRAATAAVPHGVYAALAKFVAGDCAHASPAFARRAFDVRGVALADGRTLYEAVSTVPCSDAFVALVRTGPDVYVPAYADDDAESGFGDVLDGPTYRNFERDGSAEIIDGSNDLRVPFDELLRLEGSTYRVVGKTRFFRNAGEVKPSGPVAIRFARGASSARLRGDVYAGFDDTYSLIARAGQRLTIEIRARKGKLAPVSVDGVARATAASFVQRFSVAISSTGRHVVNVDGADAGLPAIYTMTISIR